MNHAQVVAAASDANASATGLNRIRASTCRQEQVRPIGAPEMRLRFSSPARKPVGPSSWRNYRSRPAGGPPPHIHHREDESFYVREGTLAIRMGDRTVNAAPGDFVHIPRGTVHCFKNTGNGHAKMLVTFTPAGMEKFFEEAFHPAGDRSAGPPLVTEELLARLIGAAPKSGLEFLPPELH